ncbi:aryl-alcohol dehydrogenase [Trametes versicolor FP-101664 SS1]|uniref:aryl-alcohol dehydrogenase n=1 Tax=Trametes versicolor (strain FP-101664) TaxID=717944 RepID=UPI00046241B0|nr:aryl-alcohol dehydrogenase [Trametes versicolor FP-101664 SS1]EIW56681.1 aryl-alcohol dehydrogenase [Trametes versicolor FP-101664 SS1]
MSDLWAPAPPPPTALGRHRRLSALAGVHVSPICLGAMSIGDKWAPFGMGAMDKAGSFKLLDAFYEAGGNFIDTANNYQDESSEEFLGEWMETRGIRDQMVIATKFTTDYKRGKTDIKQHSAYVGNSTKSLHISVEQSLKKLRTSYIDILYVHWWDYTTSIEELMNGLHALVLAGKVLYLGVSDTPAWVVAKANQYARMSNQTPFCVYQGAWNVLQRDFEREIIPLARSEGMALAPWNVLAAGKIRTDEEEQRRRETGEKGRTIRDPRWERNETERKVAKVLEGVAAKVGASNIQAVAIAYVMQKVPYVFPIIGGRKVEHLHANLEALSIALEDEHIKEIEAAVPFAPGFPHDLFGDGTDYAFASKIAGTFDAWPVQKAIRPASTK